MQRNKRLGKYKNRMPSGEINVVSLMDILTTLLFFMIIMMGVNEFSIIETEIQGPGEPSKQNSFSLQVILEYDTKAIVHVGSLKDLKMVNGNTFKRHLSRLYRGSDKTGYTKTLWGKNAEHLIKKIQDELIVIKKAFPHEMKAGAAFSDRVSYEQMVRLMSAVRSIDPKNDPVELTNLIGQSESTFVLFPSLALSEWSIR